MLSQLFQESMSSAGFRSLAHSLLEAGNKAANTSSKFT